MNRRSFLFSLLGAPTVAALVAACGSDHDQPGSASDFTLPAGPNDVVLSIAYEGGFVPVDVYFTRLPSLLITGDGRVFTPGPITEIYPGPLVMPMMVGTITPAGLQRLMKAADDARLIGFVADYELPTGIDIADAPDTVVTLSVNGKTYTHVAYALGIDDPTTPARERLAKFVGSTGDLASLVGAENVGAAVAYSPESYRIRATVAEPDMASDPRPTIVPWPASTGVPLAGASMCATATAREAGDVLTAANQLTYFQEGDLVYQVAAVMQLPGDTGCPVT
jgi:hypothetical protein